MSKEMWFDEMVRLAAEYEDSGMDPDAAYEKASNNAHKAMVDRLADMSDEYRKRQREGL